MDPFIANLDLAPPRQRVSLRGVVPALVAHALLGIALASGVQWKRTPDPSRTVSVPGLQVPADSAVAIRSPPAPASHPAAPSPSAQPVPATPRVAQAPAPGAAQRAAERSTRVAMGAAPERPAAPPVRAAPGIRPSFDCARARSSAERIICADPELSRLDRELGRLHARAKAAAPDPVAFKRQNDEEWRLRESSCRDRECLRAWYDHRREQLRETLEEAGAPPLR